MSTRLVGPSRTLGSSGGKSPPLLVRHYSTTIHICVIKNFNKLVLYIIVRNNLCSVACISYGGHFSTDMFCSQRCGAHFRHLEDFSLIWYEKSCPFQLHLL